MADKLPVIVLISGNGSNLQAFIDQSRDGRLPIDIRAVISNRPDAYGLIRASDADIPARTIDDRDYPDRGAFEDDLRQAIDHYRPKLVILAGFMRILTPKTVRHYAGRMLNIHPSLLPAFTGLNTHQRAIDAGCQRHGASIHFVTEDLDGGPVIAQTEVEVLATDTAETLAARVRQTEHVLYPVVVNWFAQGRLQYRDGQALLDGQPVAEAVQITTGISGALPAAGEM